MHLCRFHSMHCHSHNLHLSVYPIDPNNQLHSQSFHVPFQPTRSAGDYAVGRDPCGAGSPSFQDLKKPTSKISGEVTASSEEICSICLMEFEKADVVNKLPQCGHVFHRACMDKWLDRCQFTCPLCRSLVLQIGPSRRKLSEYCLLHLEPFPASESCFVMEG